jgi:hypothetical protein
MSGTITIVIVQLLTLGLPMLGVTVGTEQLTNAVQTIILVVTGLVIWYKRTRLQKAPGGYGDVGYSGMRKR